MTSNFDTSDRNAQKGGDFVPRLAMINDIAGFGRCSTTVSLPVISVMKVQVCPVPTSVLSNHLGFPLCHFDDYTSHMRDYIKVWVELGLTFDGLYCGFLGNEEQIDIVREFVEMFRPPLFLLDPVMGDHGRAYSSITRDPCSEDEGAAASGGYYHAEYHGVLPADRDSLEGWGMDAAGAVRIM
mgnify:CR=1 FL=1